MQKRKLAVLIYMCPLNFAKMKILNFINGTTEKSRVLCLLKKDSVIKAADKV